MNLILLHDNDRHVSATRTAIFRVMRTRIQIQLYCVEITLQLKNTIFGQNLRLNSKIAASNKCLLLLCNKITFINPREFVGF